MSNQEIVQKLWNLCNVLRDDGITYHQYVTELTYILFLKMLEETENEKSIKESLSDWETLKAQITKDPTNLDLQEKREIADYSWKKLVGLSGIELKDYYNKILRLFGTHCTGSIKAIYHDARSNIGEPKNLDRIITQLDKLDWYSVDKDGFGDLYEGLLEKNANEKKSGAGQYFTPRVLIDVITELVKPQFKEKCNDPACGTFGFMIAAHQYVENHTNMYEKGAEAYEFHRNEAFTGCELVLDTHRLALMNAMIHGIHSDIICADTLSNKGKEMHDYDVVMANPPFGTK